MHLLCRFGKTSSRKKRITQTMDEDGDGILNENKNAGYKIPFALFNIIIR